MSDRSQAAVYQEIGSRYERSRVRSQEKRGLGNVLGCTNPAEWMNCDNPPHLLFRIWQFIKIFPQERSIGIARTDGVDTNAIAAVIYG